MKNVLAAHSFTVGDWSELAQGWMSEGLPVRAGACYRAAVDIEPANEHLWFQLGHCQTEVGMLAQAVKSFRRALAIRPTFDEARLSLIHVLLLQGKQIDAFQVVWDGKKHRYTHH